MIFGEKFYGMLGELSPWRQSLFALTLTMRQAPNFALWCEVNKRSSDNKVFTAALDKLWEFHTDKFNHIDLEKVVEAVEVFIPEKEDDLSLGDLFALDACLSLTASCDAIIMHEGDEAEIASRTSLGGVVRRVEQEFPDYDDEQLRELPAIDAEVNFQVELMEELKKSERNPILTAKLRKLALADGMSNIGILADPAADTQILA